MTSSYFPNDNDNNMNTDTSSALLKAFELGAASSGEIMTNDNGDEYIVLPDGWAANCIYEHEREHPTLYKGTRDLRTVNCLATYVNSFPHLRASTKAYASSSGILVVLDDHGETPGNKKFGAKFLPTLTPQFVEWNKNNCEEYFQAVFADFIENNLEDIIEPAGSEMLEIVSTLQSQSAQRFKSSIDLHSGARQLVWEDSEETSAGKTGQLTVPREFKIQVQIYDDIPTTAKLTAKLRFRKKDGALKFHYKLIRPERAIQLMQEEFRKEFRELCPDIPLFLSIG